MLLHLVGIFRIKIRLPIDKQHLALCGYRTTKTSKEMNDSHL